MKTLLAVFVISSLIAQGVSAQSPSQQPAPGAVGVSCAIPQGTGRFRVRADSLVGELRLDDDTKFRDVRTIRAKVKPP